MIKPVGGGKYKVYSETGKPMSKPLSKRAAHRRLAQIEYFKRHSK